MNKSILIGSVAVLGIFVALFLMSPVFAHMGYGMMGNYNGQNWGWNGCTYFKNSNQGNVGGNGNGWGMMNWNGNGNYGRGMMGNWR